MIVEKNAKWVTVSAFDYVRGRIKNNSRRTVTYWKVTAEYIDDRGQACDSDAVESRKALRPGATHPFEIKHIHTPLARHARVDVADVRFAE